MADALLMAAGSSDSGSPEAGISVLLVPSQAAGGTIMPLQTIAADRQYEVELRQVEAGYDAVVGPLPHGWPFLRKTLDYATVATCAAMVGMAQVVCDMSVEYAKNRVQFSRPIGSFQAIKHKCSDMGIDVDGSRFITYRAAWHLPPGLDATKEIAMAKAWSSAACRRVCASAHQIHGGIGFTKEYDLQLFFRRAKHGEVVAQEIGL